MYGTNQKCDFSTKSNNQNLKSFIISKKLILHSDQNINLNITFLMFKLMWFSFRVSRNPTLALLFLCKKIKEKQFYLMKKTYFYTTKQ